MALSTLVTRSTKYCTAVEEIVGVLGHGTNTEIHNVLTLQYPEVSLTTVHRVTARLAARGLLGSGPMTADGSLRYDANIVPHDHFICLQCGVVKDMVLGPEVMEAVESALEGCKNNGQLIVQGTCKNCCSDKKSTKVGEDT